MFLSQGYQGPIVTLLELFPNPLDLNLDQSNSNHQVTICSLYDLYNKVGYLLYNWLDLIP